MAFLRYLIASLFGICTLPNFVTARFCEGGHICSLPRECCTQGCCPPFQNGPRQLPPATDHVLNLFFISHWYFWCLVVAILLAILCAYSLWKKRRQLCGWGHPDHHTQSEGDSAGSCYAPPQYSRCSSFHHPPPPYTEVTSKPDLYPLVFTCNGDNGKNGASYLMVQYFRNYIVRPAGSLSATSTVDSLSSSFICTANEANTLVPPPYSRAASPDATINSQFQQHFVIPRSASQLVCSQNMNHSALRNIPMNFAYNNVTNNNNNNNRSNIINNNQMEHQQHQQLLHSHMQLSESVNFQNTRLTNGRNRCNSVIASQSDQQFRYIANSNSSLSDIFVNNSCGGEGSFEANTVINPVQAQANIDLKSSGTNEFINGNNPLSNSCSSIGGISITVPVATDAENDFRDLDVLRRNLETCCQILQQKQMPSASFNSADSPINVDMVKKFDGARSYVTSTTCSAVSSLANIDSPSSPPQATSPTGEVKDLLEQIRQLKVDNSIEYEEVQQVPSGQMSAMPPTTPSRRPSTLQSKKKFFSKPNKAMYIPISNISIRTIRSPVGATSFLARGRGRRGWVSRSAPTTPGTTLPPNALGDDSPLLNEHDEDAEQNA